jgi:hypothetical protein
MKKRTALMTLVVAVGLCGSGPASAAQAAATATMATAISISRILHLRFGYVVPSGTPGTVLIDPSSERTFFGGVTPVFTDGGQHGAASFNVVGTGTLTYAITLPVSVTLTSGGNLMTVDEFVSTPPQTGQLAANGKQSVVVGATLHVLANQPIGIYTGTFDVSVAYN